MEISAVQAAQTFMFGAAGTLSALKVWQVLTKRREKATAQQRELFPIPRDEHEQVVRAIDDLRRANRERYAESQDIKADLRRIADHVGIDLINP